MGGRFEVGDQVTNKTGGRGIVIDKKTSESARLVGDEKFIYRVRGPGFDADQWYQETSLLPTD